jgi:superfamily II DNA or RNA helicase
MAVLGALLDEVAGLLGVHLDPEDRSQILEDGRRNDQRRLIKEIRSRSGIAAKLLKAVGEEAIRAQLPTGLVPSAGDRPGRRLDGIQLAELAHAVFGVEVLRAFREDLEKAGFPVPQQWAGSHAARQFVQDLRIPPEYAGFSQARRDPTWDVDGPPKLKPLHPFQRTVAENIRSLFKQGGVQRGLLSLPTGAGKTRVAVEALVGLIAEGKIEGLVLWVAQSDELCEQAVQAWGEVWRSVGPQKTLRISRLWAQNEADMYQEGVQLVVATIQKLTNLFEDESYDWLKLTECVVIDEAHYATEASYSDLLRWQELETTARAGAKLDDRCPLIGLTATPFRGGEVETERLAGRSGRFRLDGGVLGDDPYAALQDLGVLSQVDHELLGGSNVKLTPKELGDLSRMGVLPPSAGEKLGRDENRNATLLESIKSRPADWPILMFCVSVDHARTMAALLTRAGISARPISGETDPGARKHYIKEFREKKIRVLTNYGVLSTGFDAPKVRAVYIARPVFSPVIYQQMIGRGLRGVENGGTERCLIVNVGDTFAQFGVELAFRKFEHLWRPR